MTTLADFRKQYPQYDDMDDAALSDALYRKYYSDIPRADFDAKIGYQSPKEQESSTIKDVGQQSLLGFNRGINDLIGLPGEALASGAEFLGVPHEYADKLRWNNPVSRAIGRPDILPETTAGRYAESVGRGFGASVAPEAAIWAKGLQAARAVQPATSTLGQVVRNIGETIAENPASAAAASAASITGASLASHHAAENGFGPVGQTIAGIVGGVTPAAVGAGARGSANAIRNARANQGEAGAYGSMVDDIGRSVDEFKNEVAAGPSRQNVGTNRRTLDILGEEMVNHGGDVAAAQVATVQRIMREYGVSQQTARNQVRRLTEVHEDSDLFLSEYPAVASSDAAQRMRQPGNTDLDELGRIEPTATQNTIDYLVNKGSAQSARDTKAALIRRQETLAPSMRESLQEIGPQVQTGPRTYRPATIEDADDMIDAATTAGRLAYNIAHSQPLAIPRTQFQQDFENFITYWEGRAARRAGAESDAIRAALREFRDHEGNLLRADGPDGLQLLQDARSAIGRTIRKAEEREGDQNIVNALQPLYNDTQPNLRTGQTVPNITEILQRASPQWAQANRQWADMNFQEMGRRLGDSFAEKAGPRFREQIREFRGLAPEAQDIVRIHFLQKLYDKLDNLGDEHSVSKLFRNDHARNTIRQLFDDDAAISFARAARDQKVAEITQGALGNSKTEVRRETKKQKDADTGLMAAVESANVRGARNWIVEKLSQVLTERKNRPLSEIMTTPMSDTARVAMHLRRMQMQADRMAQIRQRAERARLRPYAGPASALIKEEDDGRSKLLAEARAAIRAGAPRSAVIDRVRKMGVDPMGL